MKTKPSGHQLVWVDNLRSSIILLVVAHHAALAYTTFANFDSVAYIRSTHAIVDIKRWVGLDVFVNFNDIFFMSLMFLIGGLFLSQSIQRKGRPVFVLDRFKRLFLPFLLGGTILMLVSYFPAFYVAHGSTIVPDYMKDFFLVEKWPVGPPWFIWVLFLFNWIFALSHGWLSGFYARLGEKLGNIKDAKLLFMVFFMVTWVLFVPLAYTVGGETWTGLGPFDFQVSRILLYFGYFMLGVVLGNTDFNGNLFSQNSDIGKKWWLWAILAVVVFSMLRMMSPILTQWVEDRELGEFTAWMVYYTLFSVSCTTSSIAAITLFRRKVQTQSSLSRSLSQNAYLIYMLHFVFVVWCQFALLDTNLSAFTKFLATFLVSLSLSWIVAHLLRKNRILN